MARFTCRRLTSLVAVAVFALLTVQADPALAASPQGAYADWWSSAALPRPEGYYNLDQTINVSYESYPSPGQVNQAYFFARQFGFQWATAGQGGYIGIQTDVNGKRAIFSIFGDVTKCTGPGNTNPDADGGPGCHTDIPYQWVAGHNYRLRLWNVGREASTCQGVNQPWCVYGTDSWIWVGAIGDLTTNTEAVVGYIGTPTAWGEFSNYAGNFLEWYAPQPATCEQYPGIRGQWKNTMADAGLVVFDQVTAHTSAGDCKSLSKVVDGRKVTMAMGWNA